MAVYRMIDIFTYINCELSFELSSQKTKDIMDVKIETFIIEVWNKARVKCLKKTIKQLSKEHSSQMSSSSNLRVIPKD